MSASRRFEMYYFYGKINRGKGAVRCREVVHFSEGPLLEVLLYMLPYQVLNFYLHVVILKTIM